MTVYRVTWRQATKSKKCYFKRASTTIGNNVVIGAGSVISKDIPDNMIAVGNPCKVIREITDEDRIYYFKKQKFDEEAWDEINNK